jgi:hypothetical protein
LENAKSARFPHFHRYDYGCCLCSSEKAKSETAVPGSKDELCHEDQEKEAGRGRKKQDKDSCSATLRLI